MLGEGDNDLPFTQLQITSPILPDKPVPSTQDSADPGSKIALPALIGFQDSAMLGGARVGLPEVKVSCEDMR